MFSVSTKLIQYLKSSSMVIFSSTIDFMFWISAYRTQFYIQKVLDRYSFQHYVGHMSKHRNNSSLYFAYGANLNLNTMSKRCSTATPLRTVSLFGWKLIFRGVADIIPSPGDVVHGGLYRVHPNDEAALDRFEGVDIGLYTRIDLDDGTDEFFAYKMNGTDEMAPPYASYLNVIRQGYLDWNLPDDQLKNALKPFTNVKS